MYEIKEDKFTKAKLTLNSNNPSLTSYRTQILEEVLNVVTVYMFRESCKIERTRMRHVQPECPAGYTLTLGAWILQIGRAVGVLVSHWLIYDISSSLPRFVTLTSLATYFLNGFFIFYNRTCYFANS